MNAETRPINATQQDLMLEALGKIINRARIKLALAYLAHHKRFEYSPWIVTQPNDHVPVHTDFTWSLPFMINEPIRYKRRGRTGAKADPKNPQPKLIIEEVKYQRPRHRPGKAAAMRQLEKRVHQ